MHIRFFTIETKQLLFQKMYNRGTNFLKKLSYCTCRQEHKNRNYFTISYKYLFTSSIMLRGQSIGFVATIASNIKSSLICIHLNAHPVSPAIIRVRCASRSAPLPRKQRCGERALIASVDEPWERGIRLCTLQPRARQLWIPSTWFRGSEMDVGFEELSRRSILQTKNSMDQKIGDQRLTFEMSSC